MASKDEGMVEIRLETEPPDLMDRLHKFPGLLDKTLWRAMTKSLTMLKGKIGAYPPQEPDSTYKRTGNLGKGFGKSMGGADIGRADIQEVRKLGHGSFSGEFGSNVAYASKVVGPDQRNPFSRYWWTFWGIISTNIDKQLLKIYDAELTMAFRKYLQ